MLETGSLDIGLLRLPIGGHSELEVVTVHREPFVLVVPASHKLAKRKRVRLREVRSRIRLELVLCDDWHGNTGCLVAQDLALLTKVRTLIHEEISLLTVLKFPLRVRTPKQTAVLVDGRWWCPWYLSGRGSDLRDYHSA